MHRCKSIDAGMSMPAQLAVRGLLILLFAGVLSASISAGALANPPAAKAPANHTTPPAIKGPWPTFSISGTFDPKQVTNSKVTAFWTVDTKGHTLDIHLDKSSGSKAVDGAIVHYIRSLHFAPAMRDGKPVEERMEHTFEVSVGNE